MTSKVAIEQGTNLIANADKFKDISITVASVLFIIFIILFIIKFYFDSILAKKEAESVAKDNLLEAKIKTIEEKVNNQARESNAQYNSFYSILTDIKEKLISKDDLINLIDVRIGKHKENCKGSKIK